MKKQPTTDDILFEALGKSKKKRKRKIIKTVVIIVIILAVIAAAGIIYLRNMVQEQFADNAVEAETYEATIGTLNTVISSYGTLSEVGIEEITFPAAVELEEVLVKANQLVNEGDILATVNMTSVLVAMSDVQSEIDTLDAELAEATDEDAEDVILAGVSGRVKMIYPDEGANVSSCMYENGALALVSLDGYMAVDIEATALAVGDEVTVVLSDGDKEDGFVDALSGTTATILLDDNGPEYDDLVTVRDSEGNDIGTGNLYIHNPLAVTGYAGTVSDILVSENETVDAETELFELDDTNSVVYDSLLRQRSEKEQQLLELMNLYQDSAIYAPYSGLISTVDFDPEAETTESTQTSYGMGAESSADTQTLLLTMTPNEQVSVTISIDETDILSLTVGQEADVVVRSIGEDVYTGQVTEISDAASSSNGVTQYTAVVTLSKVENMRPGMTAEVDIKLEGVENALLIPVAALNQTSSIYYVYTSIDEEAGELSGQTEVTVGFQNGEYAQITSGLEEGDVVYYTEEEMPFDFGGFGGFGGGFPGGDDSGGGNPFEGGGGGDPFGGGNPFEGGGGGDPFGGGGFPGGGMPFG